MTESELVIAACLHCGGTARTEPGMFRRWFVVCNSCGATANSDDGEAEAITAWNRRPSAGPAGENAELIELLGEAEGAAQWLDLMADRFEGEWPNTSKHCRIHVNSLRAALAALQANLSDQRVKRLEKALRDAPEPYEYMSKADFRELPSGMRAFVDAHKTWLIRALQALSQEPNNG